MADYCALADVQQKMQHITFTVTSKPKTTDVTHFCGEITVEMDAKMRSVGVTLPITDADKLELLQKISINGVIAIVYRSIEMETERSEMYQKLYEDALNEILENPAIISETSAADVGVAYYDGDDSRSSTDERPFRREHQDW
jgi:hypothetical protein